MKKKTLTGLEELKIGYGETEFEEDVDRLRRAADGHGETEFEEAAVGPKDPSQTTQQSAQSSAALHQRDKSQMQGVGPRPTMANAFGNEQQPQKKETIGDQPDPNKTSILTPNSPNAQARAQQKQQRMDQIKNVVGPQGQQSLEKDGWKFEKDPSGNWTAKPPSQQ